MVLAQYHDGRLHYAGRAGSGFSDRDLADLSARFKKLRRRDAPLDQKPPAGVARKVRSLDPELGPEIAFGEFTRDGIVRHGRFICRREDKPAGTVEREKATPVRAV